MIAVLLIISICFGQLLKFPGGLVLLDAVILLLDIFFLYILKFKLKKPPFWIISSLIFIVVASFSLLLTPLKLQITEYVNSFAYNLRFFLYILLGYLIYLKVFPVKNFHFQVFVWSSTIISITGLLQLIFVPNLKFLLPLGWDPHYFRTVSTLLDPNFLGGFLVLNLLFIIQNKELFKKRWLFLFSFTVCYLALVTTFSRSSALMFAVSFIIFSLLSKSFKLGILTLALSLGIASGTFFYGKAVASPKNIDRLQSAQYRITSWQQGLEIFNRSPLTGVGFNSYRYALEQYHLASKNYTGSRGSTGNDSSLLFVAATTGIIGLSAFVTFLISLLYLGFKKYQQGNKLGITLIAGIAGLLIQSLFINSLFYPWILIWIILVSSKLSLDLVTPDKKY